MQPEESLPPLSAAQAEIMGVVWERGEVSLAEVYTSLAARRELARTTVQTQLSRLVEKGWLSHRTEGKTFFYRATGPREAAQAGVVQRLVDAVFLGSAEGMLMSLLDGRKLSKEQADRIRALIERAEEEQP